MRILFLSLFFEPDLSAGSFRNTSLFRELISQLSSDDHVDVITTKPNRYGTYSVAAESVEYGGNYSIHRVDVPQNTSGMMDEIRAFRKYYSTVMRFTRRRKYDLVYGSSSKLFTAFLAARVAKRQGAPLYLDIRDIISEGIYEKYKKHRLLTAVTMPCLWRIEDYTFGRADHINLVSRGFEPYFAKYTRPGYTFFTNGIDDIFLGVEPTAETTPHDKTVITYAGNMGMGQGLSDVLPGLARELGDGYLLRIIGDGRERAVLEEHLATEGISNVELVKPVGRDRLREYYRESDMLFLHLVDLPPTERSLPSKLFEYSVYNIPIVAGVKGYAATFIRQELPGCIVFNPGDYVTAAKEIKTYKSEKIDRSAFIEKYARRTIMKQMAESILSLTKTPQK